MARKSPKRPSRDAPIGPGRGYVAPEPGKTHSGGSGSTERFAASQGKTDTGAAAKQYVLAGQSVTKEEYEKGIAKQVSQPSIPSAPRTTAQTFSQLATTNPYSPTVKLPQQESTLGVSQKTEEKGMLDKIKDFVIGEGLPTREDVGNVFAVLPLPIGLIGKVGSKTGNAGKAVYQAAGGKFIPKISEKIITNTKTAKLTSSLIGKLGLTLGAAYLVKEAVGTYPFAKFEMAETMDKIGIAMFQASKNKDWELVKELSNIQNEIANPDKLDKILSWIPWANVYNAAKKNTEAALVSAKAFNYLAQQEQLKQQNNETDAQMWERIYREQDERKEREKTEDTDYYAQIAENQRRAREEQRAADEAYWNDILKKQKESQEEKRKADAAYWEEVRKAWKKAREESQKSKLTFGLLK